VGTRRERTGMGRKEKRERRCKKLREDSEKIKHMRRNERERKRREWGLIGSEDGREMDERISKRRERIENERSEGEQ
jgi:hypothetical protein